MGTVNINSYFDKLVTSIEKCRKQATKTVPVQKRKNDKARQPWATRHLAALSREKAVAYKKWRSERDNEELRQNYKINVGRKGEA